MSNAVEKAYAEIRDAIHAGRFPPGTHLKEGELAEIIGVSRTPIREALRRLNAEGAVRFMRNHGAFVADWSGDEIKEIFDLRAILEGYAAEQAAVRATPEQIAHLRVLAEEMLTLEATGTADALGRIAEANAEFHRLITQAAGTHRLTTMMAQVIEVPLVLRTFHRYNAEALRRSLRHHMEIVDAFEVRDGAWAGSVMRSHIAAAWHAIEASNRGREPVRKAAE
ncbi:GntR family transcriptional regulator [Niveispirillum sp. KHB5.9]|uniref:GntR family transcriptional regulator n=1 Tax=Niveispirillum sp. KHB5.9 TaxID=3400269 RepID=UPI003A84C939